MNVYQSIAAVAKDLSSIGISKSSKNQQQGFHFRGIDAVFNTLAPLLAKHELCILPRCIDRSSVERQTAKGGTLFYVTVKAEFDLVATDGSKHTVCTFGEAMDSGDKATNKAMSAAYKYAAFQAFCIPTEETSADADAETYEVTPLELSESRMRDMRIAIQEAPSEKDIADLLKLSVQSGVTKEQLEVLRPVATKRKNELLGEQA